MKISVFCQGDAPTKEMPLHTSFYDTRSGTVLHLHSTHSVAMSIMADTDEDNMRPPLTPYSIMKLGKVKLLPFFLPGDPAMGEALRGLAGKRYAVVLANHGPVVAGKDIWGATYATEELKETAKLVMLTRGIDINTLTLDQIARGVTKFEFDR